ncbi:MAG: glycosyltransferase [Candidatus Krumholzibacteriota bacterium]|nr:glycosyltransferase [Candidatus Krumholzibacteriota bacterium]
MGKNDPRETGAEKIINIDIIVAVFNEEAEIPEFIKSVRGLRLPERVNIGIIFIEDSSTDGTVGLLSRISSGDRSIRYYAMKKGYGQGAAVAFGLSKSNADAMIMMDVDGEHPVDLIPLMIERFIAGSRIVQAVRKKRVADVRYREAGSRFFTTVTSLLTGVDLEKQNVYFRLVAGNVRDELIRNRRWPYFMRISDRLLKKYQAERIPFDIRFKEGRVSSYGFLRLAGLAVSGVLSIIPVPRFLILVSVLFLAGAAVLVKGLYYPAPILIGGAIYLIYRFISLSRTNLLGKFEVASSSDGGPEE